MQRIREFYNEDCIQGMKRYPDRYFDLAIVDPPYGDGGQAWKSNNSRFNECRFERYKKVNRTFNGKGGHKDYSRGRKGIDWDVAPPKEYFDELFRVSKHQIIWGGNYFNEHLPSNRNFIVWKKLTISETFSMAMAEYAWTSIQGNAKVIELPPQGKKDDKRFHPTQKPVELYRWLLSRYANAGDLILDTNVGSGSGLVACSEMGFDYVGFEIDEEYYTLAKERVERYQSQLNVFDFMK